MGARHPLEPLDADEIRAASAILRAAGHRGDRVRTIGLSLHRVDPRRPAPARRRPAVSLAFMLKPDGFFDRSPALDVPPSPHTGGGHTPCH